jgi:hypothetical protein
MQTCVEVEAAIARARSLFGSPSTGGVPNSSAETTDAIQTATTARDRTTEMAGGAGMAAYRASVDRGIPPLITASSSDAALTTQLTSAQAVSAAGASRLEAIAAQTRSITAVAPTAQSASAQQAVITALRNQIAQAQQVVHTSQQQANAATARISSLRYPKRNAAQRRTGNVEAVDRRWKQGPDKPSLPDPVVKLGLPNYNPGSLSNEEARGVYANGELRMRALNDQLIKQGVSPEERAKVMFEERNSLRSWVRNLMQDRADADLLKQRRPNMTWEESMQKEIARGKQGDAIYDGIIDSSTRSNAEVNAATGINPEDPGPLPPVRPSAPTEAAPPEAPPVEPGGDGFVGGPGTALGPQVIRPPHAQQHWISETPEEQWEEGQH